ncbi:MAG: hypothetical protein ABUS79_13805 [Pseudomonadota bacterium]
MSSPPTPLLLLAGGVAVADAALRGWRPARKAIPSNLLFLSIAWLPFFALPHVGPRTVTGIAALLGLLAMLDFSRVVGLSRHGRFFVPAFTLTAACFPIAALHQGALLSAVPAVALLGLAAASAGWKAQDGFLQKLALSWLAVLVYGYLYAHAVLFAHATWPTLPGPTMLALVILLAKFANVAWLAVRRLTPRHRVHLVVTPLAGFAGGKIVGALWPAVGIAYLTALGSAIGLGLAVGLRAHTMIVADVTAEPERLRKGTMIFGFGLALAVGYWVLSFVTTPTWSN